MRDYYRPLFPSAHVAVRRVRRDTGRLLSNVHLDADAAADCAANNLGFLVASHPGRDPFARQVLALQDLPDGGRWIVCFATRELAFIFTQRLGREFADF